VLIIWWRIKIAKKNNDKKTLYVKGGLSRDKDYIFTYLLIVFLLFFILPDSNIREILAFVFAIAMVLFIFWNMNVLYMNPIFTILGYNVYIIGGDSDIVLLSKRNVINSEKLIAHRISDTVYIELENLGLL
jgi:hypothetical protein